MNLDPNVLYKAWFDGSAKPNPGDMKIGGYIEDPQGNVVYEFSKEEGYGTNNEAEYKAFIWLLTVLNEKGIKNIEIKGDSALVINQVNGTWKAKDPRMITFRDDAIELLETINWTLSHVLRESNQKADALTR